MTLAQIIWDGGELFNDIVGTKDVATFISGVLFSGCGIALSLLVPDAKIPDALKTQTISGTGRKIMVGIIVTSLFLRLFGGAIAVTNFPLFITFAVGVGFLNYHLTSVLINITTSTVNKLVKQNTPPADSLTEKPAPDASTKQP